VGFLVRYLGVFALFIVGLVIGSFPGVPALGWEDSSFSMRFDDGGRNDSLIPVWGTVYFAGRTVWEVLVRFWERTGAMTHFIDRVRKT